MDSTLTFWIVFAGLNSLYFLPGYLGGPDGTRFFPYKELFSGSLRQRMNNFLSRKNRDPFRLNIDLFIIIMTYALWLRSIVPVEVCSWLLFGFVLFTLTYQVYHEFTVRIYRREPVFYGDSFVLGTALAIFISDIKLRNVLILITGIAIVLLLFILSRAQVYFAATAAFGIGSYVLIFVLAVLSVVGVRIFRYKQYSELALQSPVQSIICNVILSIRAARRVRHLTREFLVQHASPLTDLVSTPNIYFIVVESYGSLLREDERFRPDYLSLLGSLDTRLRTAGWHVASNETISPTSGGASWLSYTTMQYGLLVDDNRLYNKLLHMSDVNEYNSLFQWLKGHDYTTWRLSSVGGKDRDDIDYEKMGKLAGIDHWIQHDDLNYAGPEFGFGPSPPDQYALHFAHEVITTQSSQPFALFFITQNSHSPFHSPTEVVDDWRSLNELEPRQPGYNGLWSRPDLGSYFGAIKYQLGFLIDFIEKKGQGNDVFVLVGDHQPPSLNLEIDSFKTPIHVIANEEFTRGFQEYGFIPALQHQNYERPIRQEALLSVMVRSLVTTYGTTSRGLPDFRPKGIEWS